MSKETPSIVSREMSDAQLMRRFGAMVWPFRWYLIPAMLALIAMAATSGAVAYLVQPLLDKVFIEKDEATLALMPFVILGVFIIRGVAYFIQAYLIEFVGQKIVRTLQVKLYRHFLSLDATFHLSQSAGSLISRITYDANLLKEAASSVISNLFREGFTVIFLLGVLFYRDAELALISMVGLPAAGYVIYLLGRRMRRLSKALQELMEQVTAHLQETLSGIRVIQAFSAEPHERARFRALTKSVLKNHLRVAKVRAISKPSIDLISGMVIAGVVIYAGHQVIAGTTTTGAFFSFITALMMAYDPIKRLTALNNLMQSSLAAARRIFEMLDRLPEIVNQPKAIEAQSLTESLEFRDLTFAYDEEKDPVIRRLNLRVGRG
ncbi:ABC transporter permease [Magnetococcales bacterium HHB-1]